MRNAARSRSSEVARIELRPHPSGSGRAWRITLDLEIGRVVLPRAYERASVAEAEAREHAKTLGLQVMSASYQPGAIELELARARAVCDPDACGSVH